MISASIECGDGLPLTIGALLHRHCDERAESVLLATDAARLTYADAQQRSAALARGFLANGVSKGAHIALLLPNGPDFLIAVLAAARIGAVVLPISTLSTAHELRQLLVNSDAAYLLAANTFRGRDLAGLVAESLPAFAQADPATEMRLPDAPWLRRVWFVEGEGAGSLDALIASGSGVPQSALEAAERAVRPSDRFVIIHTSGSTGAPKGVIHQHGTLIRHLANCNAIRDLNARDVLFAVSPWFWIAGFAFELMRTFIAGARIVGSTSQDVTTVLDLIERERPTQTNGYYPAINWLAQDAEFARRDFSWLRRGNLWPIMAKDARPPDPSYRHTLYGLSEAGSAIAMSGDEDDLPEHLRGAAGHIMPGFDARIVDPDTGADCAAGEIGEMWLRGPLLMEGYYGRPRSDVFTPDGWWRSGDAVAIDAEGFVFLKGRLDNMIKTAGANVAPAEVEAAMGEMTDGAICHVLGVPDPDRGQAVVAMVFTPQDKAVDAEKLREQLRAHLSAYKVPRRILVFAQERMPTLSSGKLDLRRLREMALAEADPVET